MNVSCYLSWYLLTKPCILSVLPLPRNCVAKYPGNWWRALKQHSQTICFDDTWRLSSPHSNSVVSRVHMPFSLWKPVNTVRFVRLQLTGITSLNSFPSWLVVHIFKLNLMKRVGWITLTVFPGTLVWHGSFFCVLTSNVRNLCKLTFHKTKIIWSSYIIWWLITAVKKVTNCECLLQLHHENYYILLKNPSRENRQLTFLGNRTEAHVFSLRLLALLKSMLKPLGLIFHFNVFV